MAASGTAKSVAAAIGQCRSPRGTQSRTHPSSDIALNSWRRDLANLRCFAGLSRPGIEIVNMITNVAAVPAEGRPRPVAAQLLHFARAQAEVESGLLGRKERAAFLCPGGSIDVVFRPGSKVRTGRSFAHPCRDGAAVSWGRGSKINGPECDPCAASEATRPLVGTRCLGRNGRPELCWDDGLKPGGGHQANMCHFPRQNAFCTRLLPADPRV